MERMAASGARDDASASRAGRLPADLRWTDLQLRHPASDTAPLHAFGRWEDQPHQHLPAARLAVTPWQGLLIADEVGLGKTISAIRVLRRLHALGRTGPVIIACPGALRSKWRQELHHRADLEAVVADSGRRLLAMVERLAEGEPRVIIVSHGVLRRTATLERLMERLPEVMLTIVDEAHHCRNPKSRLHDAVQLLAMRSRHTVLMTATPVNLREEELWVQLSLLAPDRWPNLEQFHRTMGPTRMLNDVLAGIAQPTPNLPRAIDRFRALQHTIGFAGDPRLEAAEDLVLDEEAWGPTRLEGSRRRVADLVRRLRPLNDLLVRTRRRDLDWHLARRCAITVDVDLTVEEWRLYEAARRWARTLIQMRHPEGEGFDWALIVPERMASSCLPAFAAHVRRQLRREARDQMDLDEVEEDVDLAEVEVRLLRRLGDYNALVEAAEALGEVDSKYDAFHTWIRDSLAVDRDGGILLFSHFHATLEHLRRRLTEDGVSCRVITGRTPMDERDAIRACFADGRFDVLLSSEVGSEGLDQQHCHRLVNYDLPWNPMRIEQRIGRLDRFGQAAEEIEILNLAVEGTIDAAILHRLYHRIRIFEDALGMLDPLLGEAMRMVARAELDRPVGQQIVREIRPAVEDEPEDPSVNRLLDQRDEWLAERAVEEREWVGPDPGISALREAVGRHRLGIDPADLRRWTLHRLGDDAQLHPTDAEGVWMLRLPEPVVQRLAARVTDVRRIDLDTVGWAETIQRSAAGSGPHWFHVTFDREVARERADLPFLCPHHPLVRLLAETEGEDCLFLEADRPSHLPPEAAWTVCIDWQVDSLTRTTVRRWLHLSGDGWPLEEDETDVHHLLERATPTASTEMEDRLAPIAEGLLDAERRHLLPLLEELRENAEQAWHRRINREMGQLAEADWAARTEGREPDPRWVRMKNGLISRLQEELAERCRQLDALREDLNGRLEPRIAIRLR